MAESRGIKLTNLYLFFFPKVSSESQLCKIFDECVVSSVPTGPTLFANSSWYPDISKDKVDQQTTQQSYLGAMVDFDATEDKICLSVLCFSQTSRKLKKLYTESYLF